MQKITPFLWFDGQAEEAANFYVSVFEDGKIHTVNRYTKEVSEASGQPEGAVMTVDFELFGQRFTAINGGPAFKFTEAVSFMVHCEDQADLDDKWDKLSAGGETQACGWLKDKYGLSWQIMPKNIEELISDSERGPRRLAAVMQMVKIDIATLENA